MADLRRLSLTLGGSIPLALRFWDPVLGVPVSEGLLVSARPAAGGSAPIPATRSGAGLYFWPRLPGWPERQPGPGREWLVAVSDRTGRFLPVALRLPVPDTARGWLFSQPRGPDGTPRRVSLLPAPTRPAPQGFASLRGQLWDADAGAPAAHALVCITQNGSTWYAVADERGAFAALFPYPVVRPPLRASAPPAPPAWTFRLSVRYAGLAPPVVDWRAVADQPPAALLPEGAAAREVLLRFGQELIVRSEGMSVLLIRPGAATGQG